MIEDIYNETDYDSCTLMMVNTDLIAHIKRKYVSHNPRVLLSSLLLRRFHKELDIPDGHPIIDVASKVAKGLVDNDTETVNREYNVFFQLFNKWRSGDIELMKTQIKETRVKLHDTLVDEVKDDADQQWNEGVNTSVSRLKWYENKLDEYGKSPPK